MVVGLIDKARRLLAWLLLRDLLSYTLVENVQQLPSLDHVLCARTSGAGSPSDKSNVLNPQP